jgi:RHS repeat-associated protein
LQFPNGRKIDNTYDLIYRRTDVADNGGSTLAAWHFFGPSRVAELAMGNGLICTHLNNARTRSSIQEGQTESGWQGQVTPPWGDQSSDRLGYDGAGRMITKRYLVGGINPGNHKYQNTTAVVGFTTSFDRSSNKFFERHLHAESRSHLYEPFANLTPQGGYDSLDRLRRYQRGVLSSTGGHNNLGGGGIDTPISLPNTDQSRTYDLDGLGNWRRTVFEPVGGSQTTEFRQHNALNQIAKRDSTPFTYDLNGNLLDDGIRLYTWDALNRLVEVRRASDDAVIGQYTYDATGRRIRKIVSNGGLPGNIPNGMTDYLYRNWQCVEERDDANSPTKQYIWGIYIDELLQQKNLIAINNLPAGDYYPLSDLLYRTTALTDSGGALVESYDTDAYGKTRIFTAPGAGNNWWADDAGQSDVSTCAFIFTGRRYDAETKTYFYRARYYDSQLGRFIGRDPSGYEDGWNLYQYVLSRPLKWTDPTGKASWVVPSTPASIAKCKTHCAKTGRVYVNTITTQYHYDLYFCKFGWKVTRCVCSKGCLPCAKTILYTNPIGPPQEQSPETCKLVRESLIPPCVCVYRCPTAGIVTLPGTPR